MKRLFILFFILFVSGCASMPSHSDQVAARCNVQLGLAYLEEGANQRAHDKLLLALQQNPDSVDVQMAMGYFLSKIGEKKAAIPYYQRAIQLAPKSPRVQNNYGVFLCSTGRANASIGYFLAAAHNPQYASADKAYENAGLCALKVGDKRQAFRYFKQALKYNPARKKSLLEIHRLKGYH